MKDLAKEITLWARTSLVILNVRNKLTRHIETKR